MLRFPREFFLITICAVYAIAFVSIRSQIRGLYGEDGLEPVAIFLEKLKQRNELLAQSSPWQRILLYPTLVWFHEPLHWPSVFMLEVICLAGATAALCGIAQRSCRTTLWMAFLWICYLSVTQCGQTFLQFQWDALLLEVGFLAIWLAPWWRSSASAQATETSIDIFETPAAAVWTLRFLFFKFMLMSGCVKIQSRCPSWLGLTALDFHYATQPLPLPLSWYAHQSPPIINRLAVAATLLIEGPWTFFLLAPPLTLRWFGAISQTVLQIPILLSGNYNFFNILSIILAIAVLDIADNQSTNLSDRDASWISNIDAKWQSFQKNRSVARLLWVMTIGFCIYTSMEMFSMRVGHLPPEYTWEDILLATQVQFLLTVEDVQVWIGRVVPLCTAFAGSVIVFAAVWQFLRFTLTRRNNLSRCGFVCGVFYLLFTTAVSLWIFSSSAVTLSILDHPFQQTLPPFMLAAYVTTEKYRITSPYGLFRMMTGMGTIEHNGQQVSIVARPELIIEGTADNGQTWKPYHFLYKPGDVNVAPRLVTPFQPRLDWQMWFAALGNYQSAPWIVHLVHKLLQGSPTVKNLLETSRDPFPDSPPQAIRIQLYYYDFTRLNTTWNRALPLVEIINTSDTKSSQNWWTRTFAREYMPAIERSNPTLSAFVSHHWPSGVLSIGTEKLKTRSAWRVWMETTLDMLCQWNLSPLCLAMGILTAKKICACMRNAMFILVRQVEVKLKRD